MATLTDREKTLYKTTRIRKERICGQTLCEFKEIASLVDEMYINGITVPVDIVFVQRIADLGLDVRGWIECVRWWDDYEVPKLTGEVTINRPGTKVRCSYRKNLLHRINGPAITNFSVGKINGRLSITKTSNAWFKNGRLHRIGGPAITRYAPGCKYVSWYENGWRIYGKDNIIVLPN